MKALVVIQRPVADPVTDWMVEPFRAHRLPLLLKLGLWTEFKTVERLEDVAPAITGSGAAIAFVATSWRHSSADTQACFSQLRERVGTSIKLVYLDSFDQSSSRFFGILGSVDLYIKKQLLKDRRQYLAPSATGYVFSDFLQSQCAADLQGWQLGMVAPDPAQLAKLVPGWNLATKKQLMRRLKTSRWRARTRLAQRKLDVHCRVSVKVPEGERAYYPVHRRMVSQALTRLDPCRTAVNVAGGTAIAFSDFKAELRSSKLCVSPFGWGEVTDRDYEIVINESALVKPDMSHLETEPDIYLSGKTYIPFRWDTSDLVEVCHYYLANLGEAQRIATSAREAYQRWHAEARFLGKIEDVLGRVGAR
jgi:Glycosyl transferases group 1